MRLKVKLNYQGKKRHQGIENSEMIQVYLEFRNYRNSTTTTKKKKAHKGNTVEEFVHSVNGTDTFDKTTPVYG